MKKDFFSIEDLAQGKCAVINDGTLDELREVLGKAFPDDEWNAKGDYTFYFNYAKYLWAGDDVTGLPTQSVKDFLHDFRVGDLVTLEGEDHVCVISCIDKGKSKLDYNNGWVRSNASLDELTPYYKKGDKAEVIKPIKFKTSNKLPFGIITSSTLDLDKGGIVEFDGDNTIRGIKVEGLFLKDYFKRIRSGEIKYDTSSEQLKTLNAAKKAHKESIKEINAKISKLQQAVDYDHKTLIYGNWLIDTKDGRIVPSSDFLDFYSKGVESYKKLEDNPLAGKNNTDISDLSDAIGTWGSLLDPNNKIKDWIESLSDTRVRQPERHSHYNNENGSLYKIAEQLGLNAYEFDILKRIARCRKKGQFKQDLQKIKDTVDLYLKEVEHD